MTTCLRYVRGRAVTSKGIEGDKYLNRNGQIAAILDQKNYVEELNRQLK